MNIKRLLILSTTSLFIFSCNRSRVLSIAEAKQFVKDNYSNKTVQTVKKIDMSEDLTQTKSEESRIIANELCKSMCEEHEIPYVDNSLKFSYELTSEDLGYDALKARCEQIEDGEGFVEPEEGTKLEFVACGAELTLTYTTETVDEETSKIIRRNISTTNGNGQYRYFQHYYLLNNDIVSISDIHISF